MKYVKSCLIITMFVGVGYADECFQLGDLDSDGGWNVIDIVMLANCVLAHNCAEQSYAWCSDINGDGQYNILDIVTLANCVLANNCGG